MLLQLYIVTTYNYINLIFTQGNDSLVFENCNW